MSDPVALCPTKVEGNRSESLELMPELLRYCIQKVINLGRPPQLQSQQQRLPCRQSLSRLPTTLQPAGARTSPRTPLLDS
ncbi:UNVERIFIED_CONTAM: hypothetical protein Sradi_4569900 [Sesamum radiatum]|uniref:Uncharacterized protein n=1 Tax=Sesamum radiatum TaxID=300843 RepID=A0AAW2NAP9_SESRA